MFIYLCIITQTFFLYHILYAQKKFFRTKKFRKFEKQIEDEVKELLRTFNLLEKADEKAENLSYGEQRRLEIARALATKPQLLLLDEPAAGMNPQETKDLSFLIKSIRDN